MLGVYLFRFQFSFFLFLLLFRLPKLSTLLHTDQFDSFDSVCMHSVAAFAAMRVVVAA